MRRIGLLVKKPENIFSNGCIQQALFLKKCLKNMGVEVDFMSIEADYTEFEICKDEIIFTDHNFDFSEYGIICLASLVLLPNRNKDYIDNIKKYNLKLINLICGNLGILLQEEFIFNKHNILHHYIHPNFSENWVLEMYDYSQHFINLLTNKPTFVMPYIWDPDIISEYLSVNNISFKTTKNNSKINLLIFEPNMSIHKSAFIPLLIAERYNKLHGSNLNKVYVFCSKDVFEHNQDFISGLSIYNENKLESYGRIVMPYILNVIEDNNNFLNVVISHNVMNPLNFLHLEMFYLGIPIVHNCKPFEDNEYYYSDFTTSSEIVNMLDNIRKTFDKEMYTKKCSKIIDLFSSSNTTRIQQYKDYCIPLLIDTPKNASFYHGSGYLIHIGKDSSIQDFVNTISFLNKSIFNSINMECIIENKKITKHQINKCTPFNQLFNISIIEKTTENIVKSSSFSTVHLVPLNIDNLQDIISYSN